MARTDNLSNFLTDVATAIKTKKGDDTDILAANFDTEITNLPSGGTYQEKSVTLYANGSTTITPDIGYDAIEQLDVVVQVPEKRLQTKSMTITSNTTTTIEPDQGYDGFSELGLEVNVPTGGLPNLPITIPGTMQIDTFTDNIEYQSLCTLSQNIDYSYVGIVAYGKYEGQENFDTNNGLGINFYKEIGTETDVLKFYIDYFDADYGKLVTIVSADGYNTFTGTTLLTKMYHDYGKLKIYVQNPELKGLLTSSSLKVIDSYTQEVVTPIEVTYNENDWCPVYNVLLPEGTYDFYTIYKNEEYEMLTYRSIYENRKEEDYCSVNVPHTHINITASLNSSAARCVGNIELYNSSDELIKTIEISDFYMFTDVYIFDEFDHGELTITSLYTGEIYTETFSNEELFVTVDFTNQESYNYAYADVMVEGVNVTRALLTQWLNNNSISFKTQQSGEDVGDASVYVTSDSQLTFRWGAGYDLICYIQNELNSSDSPYTLLGEVREGYLNITCHEHIPSLYVTIDARDVDNNKIPYSLVSEYSLQDLCQGTYVRNIQHVEDNGYWNIVVQVDKVVLSDNSRPATIEIGNIAYAMQHIVCEYNDVKDLTEDTPMPMTMKLPLCLDPNYDIVSVLCITTDGINLTTEAPLIYPVMHTEYNYSVDVYPIQMPRCICSCW